MPSVQKKKVVKRIENCMKKKNLGNKYCRKRRTYEILGEIDRCKLQEEEEQRENKTCQRQFGQRQLLTKNKEFKRRRLEEKEEQRKFLE